MLKPVVAKFGIGEQHLGTASRRKGRINGLSTPVKSPTPTFCKMILLDFNYII